MSAVVPAESDIAQTLLVAETHYPCKTKLARVLRHKAPVRRAWELPELRQLWDAVKRTNEQLLGIDHSHLQAFLRRSGPTGVEAKYLPEVFLGTRGILALAQRELSPASNADLAADLLQDSTLFRHAMRELRALARAPLAVEPLGFGEMSRPVTLVRRPNPLADALPAPALVFKRMAPFPDAEAAAIYVRKYEEYNRRLRDEVGLAIPDFWARTLRDRRGRTVVYCVQARLDSRALAKSILRKRDRRQCHILFHMILAEYRKVIRFNRHAGSFRIGIDGQIPNWVVRNYPGDNAPLNGSEGLWFIDTNTPMMRSDGHECLPLSFYLRSIPRMIRPFIRPLARKVLDRYFNPRTILLDFLANVCIHGRPDLLDPLLPEANDFLCEGLIEPAPVPISRAEVKRYIRHDIATWRLLRASRQIEAMLERKQGPLATFRAVREIYRRPLFEE